MEDHLLDEERLEVGIVRRLSTGTSKEGWRSARRRGNEREGQLQETRQKQEIRQHRLKNHEFGAWTSFGSAVVPPYHKQERAHGGGEADVRGNRNGLFLDILSYRNSQDSRGIGTGEQTPAEDAGRGCSPGSPPAES